MVRVFLSIILYGVIAFTAVKAQIIEQKLNPFQFTHTKSVEAYRGKLYLTLSKSFNFDIGPLETYLYQLDAKTLSTTDSVLLNGLIANGKSALRVIPGELKQIDSNLVLAVSYIDTGASSDCPLFHSGLIYFDRKLNVTDEILFDKNSWPLYLLSFDASAQWIALSGSVLDCDSSEYFNPAIGIVNKITEKHKWSDISVQLKNPDASWEAFQPLIKNDQILTCIWNHKSPDFRSNVLMDTSLAVIKQSSIVEPNSGPLNNTLHRHGDFIKVDSSIYQIGNSRSYLDSFLTPENKYGYWNLALTELDSNFNVSRFDTLPLSGYDISTSFDLNADVNFNFDGISFNDLDSVIVVSNSKSIGYLNYPSKDTTSFYIYNLNLNTNTINWSRKITRSLINGDQSVACLPNNRYAISFNQYDWVSNASPNLETVVWILDDAGNIINQREWSAPRRWSVYPNPIEHELRLSKSWRKDKTYRISDMQGRAISEGVLKAGENSIRLNKLPVGQYIFSIAGAQQQIIKQ